MKSKKFIFSTILLLAAILCMSISTFAAGSLNKSYSVGGSLGLTDSADIVVDENNLYFVVKDMNMYEITNPTSADREYTLRLLYKPGTTYLCSANANGGGGWSLNNIGGVVTVTTFVTKTNSNGRISGSIDYDWHQSVNLSWHFPKGLVI